MVTVLQNKHFGGWILKKCIIKRASKLKSFVAFIMYSRLLHQINIAVKTWNYYMKIKIHFNNGHQEESQNIQYLLEKYLSSPAINTKIYKVLFISFSIKLYARINIFKTFTFKIFTNYQKHLKIKFPKARRYQILDL